MATTNSPSPSSGPPALPVDPQTTRTWTPQTPGRPARTWGRTGLQDRQAPRFRAHRPATDQDRRQGRRRGLRCSLVLMDSRPGTDSQPQSIPAQCYNISDTGLYGTVSIGHGIAMGQRYTFHLRIPERGPESTPHQMVSQQGIIVRTELLISPDGQNDRVGIGVRLVGPRSGVVPMPEHVV
jgi:hypothetical protein